jgi:ribosomal protein S18 acetylase RimI-like enzyme
MPADAPFVIRRATEKDVPALGRLGALLMRTHYGFDPQRFLAPGTGAEAGYGRFLGSQLSEDDSVVFVAVKDGAVIGYVFAGLEPMSWKELRGPAGFIHDIMVADDAQGAGVGQELVDAAIAWLQERGAPRVLLWTAEGNERAQRLFQRLGFRRTMIEMTRDL